MRLIDTSTDRIVLIAVRHGQSNKNLRNVNGGKGEPLTELGKKQVQDVSKQIIEHFKDMPFVVYASPVVQAIETAEIICDQLKKSDGVSLIQPEGVVVSDELTPIGLGVLSGLSDEEIELNYPEYFESLSKWRKREIEACELCIPGMELETLFERGKIFLNSIHPNAVNIVTCTRSTFVLLCNLLAGHDYHKGGGYKHIDVKNCGHATFILCNGNIVQYAELTDVII